MGSVMGRQFWDAVVGSGSVVPAGHSLADLTDCLVVLLGDPDPHMRDEVAYPVLAAWISGGSYTPDERRELGGRMLDGLATGLGETGTGSVLRRSFSSLILAELIDADIREPYLAPAEFRAWRDAAVHWYLAEQDLRGMVPSLGWAHAVAHGSDLIMTLARSPHVDGTDLADLLDVIGRRLTTSASRALVDAEEDRLAYATMAIFLRDLVPRSEVADWLRRLTDATHPLRPGDPDYLARVNTLNYLRALHFQLAAGVRPMPGVAAPEFFDRDPADRPAILAEITAALGKLDYGFWRTIPAP